MLVQISYPAKDLTSSTWWCIDRANCFNTGGPLENVFQANAFRNPEVGRDPEQGDLQTSVVLLTTLMS